MEDSLLQSSLREFQQFFTCDVCENLEAAGCMRRPTAGEPIVDACGSPLIVETIETHHVSQRLKLGFKV